MIAAIYARKSTEQTGVTPKEGSTHGEDYSREWTSREMMKREWRVQTYGPASRSRE
jgi:hypothetical protein